MSTVNGCPRVPSKVKGKMDDYAWDVSWRRYMYVGWKELFSLIYRGECGGGSTGHRKGKVRRAVDESIQ
jgi:hypothetical protein